MKNREPKKRLLMSRSTRNELTDELDKIAKLQLWRDEYANTHRDRNQFDAVINLMIESIIGRVWGTDFAEKPEEEIRDIPF